MSDNNKLLGSLLHFRTGSSYVPIGGVFTDSEVVTPERYQEILETDRGSIVSARIKPPVLGMDNGFGAIEVKYRTPRLIEKNIR